MRANRRYAWIAALTPVLALAIGSGRAIAQDGRLAGPSPQATWTPLNPPGKPLPPLPPPEVAPIAPAAPAAPNPAAPGVSTPPSPTPPALEPNPIPTTPATEPTPTPPAAAPAPDPGQAQVPPPAAADPAAPAVPPGAFDGAGAAATNQGGAASAAPSAFAMIGDMSPPFSIRAAVGPPATPIGSRPPPTPSRFARSLIAPSVRGFKIAENQSPIPQDRVFFSFNYFNDVNKTVNRFFEAPIKDVQIYRYFWGFEKTFNGGLGSFGLRLPLDNISASPTSSLLNTAGTSTSLGNLTFFAKHILYLDPATGSLASGGLAISPRTGPRQFAGAPFLGSSNTTSIQPYFAYYLNMDRFYIQGFNAIDVPVDFLQPTLLYADAGMGYYLYRSADPEDFISGIAPTVEVHANIPLNHRNAYNLLDRYAVSDVVNITSGLNVRFGRRAALTMAIATPVTSPRPFTVEPQVLFNVYFGRTRRGPIAAPFPLSGG